MNWILAGAGACLASWSAYHLWRGWSATYWPTTDGEIVTSTVRERRGRRELYYLPEVRYRYTVDT
ncbi:MAG TPA: DUF3592 domain-containing protein, partial [Gemmatirosa sp.]